MTDRFVKRINPSVAVYVNEELGRVAIREGSGSWSQRYFDPDEAFELADTLWPLATKMRTPSSTETVPAGDIDPVAASAALRQYTAARERLAAVIGVDLTDDRQSLFECEITDDGTAVVSTRYWCDGDDVITRWVMD